MLELHCHTTCSDGTLTPTELVQEALKTGVKALAITDHDTLAGWDEAIAAAGNALEIVPGIELSTTENGHSVHILGFYPQVEALAELLQERLQGRWERAIAMVEKLRALGYPIELPALDPSTAPGRPHIASALLAAGHVETRDEAFSRFLGQGKPAYVPYAPLETCEGIRALRQAGAVPVWAHPYLWKGGSVEAILPQFVEAGLLGLEVYHPSNMLHQRQKLEALCGQYGLIRTGGSDYHGPDERFSDRPSLNHYNLPLTLLDPLKKAAQNIMQP